MTDFPRHHDFTRLLGLIIEANDLAVLHRGDVLPLLDNLVDVESAERVAVQQAKASLNEPAIQGMVAEDPERAMISVTAAAWIEGLRVGIRFQQEGGHTVELDGTRVFP